MATQRISDNQANIDGIQGEDDVAHSERIEARFQRFDALLSQQSALNFDRIESEKVFQSEDEIDAIQEQIVQRMKDGNWYLLANEHIFGGQKKSVYIPTGGKTTCEFGLNARRLRNIAKREFHESAFYYERIIEINLFEDKKLQKVISVFGAMLENIEEETCKDPYWMLAKFVRNLFEQNKAEEEYFAKLIMKEDQAEMAHIDDKKLSGIEATLIGDMIGSFHDCAPSAILFKVIADFFEMPCRVAGNRVHAFNLGLDQQGKWQPVDVSRRDFQGMEISQYNDAPSIPVDPKSVWDYSKFDGNKAVIPETQLQEQSLISKMKRRMIPVSMTYVAGQIHHIKMLRELEEFLLNHFDTSAGVPIMHKMLHEQVSTILEDLHVIEGALQEMTDERRRNDLQAEHIRLQLLARQKLFSWIGIGLKEEIMKRLRGPLIVWLTADRERKFYLPQPFRDSASAKEHSKFHEALMHWVQRVSQISLDLYLDRIRTSGSVGMMVAAVHWLGIVWMAYWLTYVWL